MSVLHNNIAHCFKFNKDTEFDGEIYKSYIQTVRKKKNKRLMII